MILGVTLARGGSTGLPRKNIRLCAGKPLIAWTIEAAKRAVLLDEYVVSTEDQEIAQVAASYGAKVLPRPPELASGTVNRWQVLQDLLAGRPRAATVVLLQATSPVRSPGLIDACIRQYLSGDCTSLATGFWHHDSPYPDNCGANRQELPSRFFDDGNVYVWPASLIKDSPIQDAGERPGFRVTGRRENVDINDEFDLWFAEQVLNANTLCPAE